MYWVSSFTRRPSTFARSLSPSARFQRAVAPQQILISHCLQLKGGNRDVRVEVVIENATGKDVSCAALNVATMTRASLSETIVVSSKPPSAHPVTQILTLNLSLISSSTRGAANLILSFVMPRSMRLVPACGARILRALSRTTHPAPRGGWA